MSKLFRPACATYLLKCRHKPYRRVHQLPCRSEGRRSVSGSESVSGEIHAYPTTVICIVCPWAVALEFLGECPSPSSADNVPNPEGYLGPTQRRYFVMPEHLATAICSYGAADDRCSDCIAVFVTSCLLHPLSFVRTVRQPYVTHSACSCKDCARHRSTFTRNANGCHVPGAGFCIPTSIVIGRLLGFRMRPRHAASKLTGTTTWGTTFSCRFAHDSCSPGLRNPVLQQDYGFRCVLRGECSAVLSTGFGALKVVRVGRTWSFPG